MPDPRVILNRNSTFDNWNGGNPTDYTLDAGGGQVSRLRRIDPRSDPKRQWFPKKLKASSYIFDGESSFGWEGQSAQSLVLTTDRYEIAPLMKVSFVVVYKFSESLSSINTRVRMFNSAVQPIVYVGQNNYVSVRQPQPGPATPPPNLPGRPAAYFLNSTEVTINLKATEGDPQEYWVRYATAAIDVPSEVSLVDFQFACTASNTPTYVSLGEMRIEAVESLVTAGG